MVGPVDYDQHLERGRDLLQRPVGDVGQKTLHANRMGKPHAIRENDGPKQEFFAESSKDFFSKTSDDELSFETGSQGCVTTIVVHADCTNVPLMRID
jgi:hypothetical protein